jgi:hypothetical protein
MMRPDAHIAVIVCVAPVDMRKQAATLALIVEQINQGCSRAIAYELSRSQSERSD